MPQLGWPTQLRLWRQLLQDIAPLPNKAMIGIAISQWIKSLSVSVTASDIPTYDGFLELESRQLDGLLLEIINIA